MNVMVESKFGFGLPEGIRCTNREVLTFDLEGKELHEAVAKARHFLVLRENSLPKVETHRIHIEANGKCVFQTETVGNPEKLSNLVDRATAAIRTEYYRHLG